MKTPFFITGLPRCRTAWLANLFCTDTTVCFHDPRRENWYFNLQETAEATELRVGISDPLLTLSFPDLAVKYPEAPWLYIERDEKQAADSLLRYTRKSITLLRRDIERWFEVHRGPAEELKVYPRTLVLNFDDLNREETVEQAWSHLLPEKPWQPLRWQVLKDLQVEQDLQKLIKERPQCR